MKKKFVKYAFISFALLGGVAAMAMPIPQPKNPGIVHSVQLKWASDVNGGVPASALVAAKNGDQSLYVCQAPYKGSVFPGQISKQGCMLSYAGRSLTMKRYEVLTGKTALQWKAPSQLYIWSGYGVTQMKGLLPSGSKYKIHAFLPVIGGFAIRHPNYLHPVYVCRAIYNNTIHLGKVIANKCNISDHGNEVVVTGFQVLFASE